MAINKDPNKIKELLGRGVNEVIDKDNLKKNLMSGKKLRVKLGIDPTSPNLHLGRASMLLKLQEFQLLGHQPVFIVGDFTGVIGDTSDKESERKMLSESDIQKNMKTYIEQAGKILDIDKVEIHYNSEWLAKLGFAEIGKQADQFSLAEFISRENIKKRLDEGRRVSLREILYPLMQGYDSVMLKADVELGGTDQRFNLLAGRTLQKYYKQNPQDILTTNLIMGTDGRKMSSSWGNTINVLDRPADMFGKIMSINDDLMISYFIHCTRVPLTEIANYEKQLKESKGNPRDLKMELAFEIVKIYWGDKGAKEGRDYFVSVFQKKNKPEEIKEYKLAGKNIVDVLVGSGLAKSKSEARRLVLQKGISVGDKVIDSPDEVIGKNSIIQKGKRYFIKVT